MLVSLTSSALRAHLAATVIRIGFPLLGVCLLTMGLLGLVSYALMPVCDALRSRDWRPVSAAVETVAVLPPLSRLHPPLDALTIRYRYSFADVEYSGDRFDPHAGLYLHSASEAVLAELRESPEIVVWVNPGDPKDAMVRRDLRWSVLLFFVPALAMSVAGALLLFAGMLAWNNVDLKLRQRMGDGS